MREVVCKRFAKFFQCHTNNFRKPLDKKNYRIWFSEKSCQFFALTGVLSHQWRCTKTTARMMGIYKVCGSPITWLVSPELHSNKKVIRPTYGESHDMINSFKFPVLQRKRMDRNLILPQGKNNLQASCWQKHEALIKITLSELFQTF